MDYREKHGLRHGLSSTGTTLHSWLNVPNCTFPCCWSGTINGTSFIPLYTPLFTWQSAWGVHLMRFQSTSVFDVHQSSLKSNYLQKTKDVALLLHVIWSYTHNCPAFIFNHTTVINQADYYCLVQRLLRLLLRYQNCDWRVTWTKTRTV